HLTNGLGTEGRLLQNFHHYILPMARVLLTLWRNQNILVQAAVVRHHKGHALFHKKAPHQHMSVTLLHFDDHTFAAPFLVVTIKTHHGNIPIAHSTPLTAIQVNIAFTIFRDQEAITFPMPLHTATHQVHFANHAISTTPVTDQLAISGHGDQSAA